MTSMTSARIITSSLLSGTNRNFQGGSPSERETDLLMPEKALELLRIRNGVLLWVVTVVCVFGVMRLLESMIRCCENSSRLSCGFSWDEGWRCWSLSSRLFCETHLYCLTPWTSEMVLLIQHVHLLPHHDRSARSSSPRITTPLTDVSEDLPGSHHSPRKLPSFKKSRPVDAITENMTLFMPASREQLRGSH